jgi:hypothetical protein
MWNKYMGSQMARSCEPEIIQALWDHTYRLLIFINDDDHKNDNRAVARYKKQALDKNISQKYNTFYSCDLLLNPLQQGHFEIPHYQLLLLSYDIRHALLRYADLYSSRSTAHNDLARGSHAQHIIYHSVGLPPPPPISHMAVRSTQNNKQHNLNCNPTHKSQDHDAKLNENAGLKSFIIKSVVYYITKLGIL